MFACLAPQLVIDLPAYFDRVLGVVQGSPSERISRSGNAFRIDAARLIPV
jgi:hypothetical protein